MKLNDTLESSFSDINLHLERESKKTARCNVSMQARVCVGIFFFRRVLYCARAQLTFRKLNKEEEKKRGKIK